MPLQLFKDSHPPRSKSTVRTTLLIRFGFALKKLTSTSNQLKMINPYVKYYLRIIRPKVNIDCEFIGKHQPPSHKCASTLGTSCSPERITCLLNGSGDLAVTEFQAAFFPSSSVTHSSLLVTWGHWDNTMVIRSVCSEPSTLKLHHPPLNRVRIHFIFLWNISLYIYLYIHASIHPSMHLSIHPSIHPSIHHSIKIYMHLFFLLDFLLSVSV